MSTADTKIEAQPAPLSDAVLALKLHPNFTEYSKAASGRLTFDDVWSECHIHFVAPKKNAHITHDNQRVPTISAMLVSMLYGPTLGEQISRLVESRPEVFPRTTLAFTVKFNPEDGVPLECGESYVDYGTTHVHLPYELRQRFGVRHKGDTSTDVYKIIKHMKEGAKLTDSTATPFYDESKAALILGWVAESQRTAQAIGVAQAALKLEVATAYKQAKTLRSLLHAFPELRPAIHQHRMKDFIKPKPAEQLPACVASAISKLELLEVPTPANPDSPESPSKES